MIDLFRLRISHFRQDRILAELFSDAEGLVARLRQEQEAAPEGAGFEQFRAIWEDRALAVHTTQVQKRLRDRLRQDTAVLLQVRRASFTNLFVDKRVSFQNRLLAYLLYRCGAFTPVVATTDAQLNKLAKEHGVPPERIVVRHGTDKDQLLVEILDPILGETARACIDDPASFEQHDDPAWAGGYFDMPGLTEVEQQTSRRATNSVKGTWRKEYLPSPVETMATAFCSAVSGLVAVNTRPGSRLRVTLHRTLLTGDEVVLQQCCDYQGVGLGNERRAGRTFPSHNGTIGAAFGRGEVVRTKWGATRDALNIDMTALSLDVASQTMASSVSSIVAVPLLGDPGSIPLAGPDGNVLGVVYLDSYDENAFVDETLMDQVMRMCEQFLSAVPSLKTTTAGRIANTEFWRRGRPRADDKPDYGPKQWKALEVAGLRTPKVEGLRHMNFDFSDFTPVEQEMSTTTHQLKSWTRFFRPIVSGDRTHELRRNDRNYGVGDLLILREFDPEAGAYTGSTCEATVTSITSEEVPCAVSGEGLSPGFCILSIRVSPGSVRSSNEVDAAAATA